MSYLGGVASWNPMDGSRPSSGSLCSAVSGLVDTRAMEGVPRETYALLERRRLGASRATGETGLLWPLR